ncbi:pyruvate dehydrogenase (acetyl-transferring) E1 component subunit alpha [Alkalilimnicola ehrlichii MLHE-1]|uniref:Pyruvate dehydrogenase E1 component subunit alpha n=1 Tax=Alkalilimnicola ehrlichii (strain ATCC BAA-1101 / DSM 17681 / MLHE-1) TaxID=187272 RepID=Q0A5F1_ALKEH|nr:pyruvate dehydrogenase (acetyl-transferring) E1 component subunit alpha [Alkalilimnicola ehrlichii]ABI57936.1 dehydrogenase, E1 component [Alkalilimnicola ehrlichii MLHE-1]
MTTDSEGKPRLSRTHLLALLRQMLRMRRFEERCVELYTQEKIRGFLHVYIGEEAVGAGAMFGLDPNDGVVATYREHGHALLNRIAMNPVMAEMYGKAAGCSLGRGGSMHLFDAEHRFYGGNAIVGGGLPLAVGLALADKLAGRQRVTACFFGDGAVAEGVFHESLNLAALWQLPVFFVCENNQYAMGTALHLAHAQTELYRKAEALGVPAERVDGMDVVAVEAASGRALASVRAGEGPRFLECETYRFRAHSMFDPQLYRDKAEVEAWQARDPIRRLSDWMSRSGALHEGELEAMDGEIGEEIDAAVAFAEQAEWESPDTLLDHVCAPVSEAPPPPPDVATEPERLSFREAFRRGLIEALTHEPRSFMMGEDIGHYGGCYAVSRGLLEQFGPERMRDTPLSENGFTGAGVGAALGGARPIVEIMTVNFSLLALDQIVNNAATLLHMSGGQFPVPLVIRMATGAGRQVAAQHSHSLENWYAHVPGLKVLAPGTLEDARHMLWAALHDPNPVVIFEHVLLYNQEGELTPCPQGVDIRQAAIRRPGQHLTLITYGGSLGKTLEAAEALAEEGIEAEVLDLRVLRPLDTEALVASVTRTQRAVIVDEGWKTGSLAAEISAILAEQALWYLDAPIARVCSAEIPIPYARHLETAALPQVEDIVGAARQVMEGAE